MTGTILRGSRAQGYRTATPLECPHCTKPLHMAGRAAEDRQGPHLVLWPVAPVAEYSAAELAHIYSATPTTTAETGVAMPQAPVRKARR